MELMLIVWAVSVLSGIKMLAESYTLLCVLAVLVVYLLSKINSEVVLRKVLRSKSSEALNSVSDRSKIQTYHDINIGCVVIPAGEYILDKYSYGSYLQDVNTRLQLNPDRIANELIAQAMRRDAPTSDETKRVPLAKPIRASGWVAGLLIVLNALLPSDTTMKYMAGAYLVQSVYESDLVQQVAPIARDAVKNQLKLWAKDAPDMDVLVRQAEQAAAAVKAVENVGPTSSTPKE